MSVLLGSSLANNYGDKISCKFLSFVCDAYSILWKSTSIG